MRRGLRSALGSVSAAAVMLGVTVSTVARADDAPDELFQSGSIAVKRGEYGKAIDTFEALADQGFVHPDASFDRGLAYVARYRAHADVPGDLGRAAAAFEETLILRPGDREADAALDLVRAEITRRRAHTRSDTVDVRPTLDRVIVSLASEEAWGIAAFVASLALVLGLALRPRAGRAHVVGSVLAPSAGVALLLFTPLAIGARSLRLSSKPGVVIVAEARLTSEAGAPSSGSSSVPEGASVEVGEQRGGLVRVRWGATEGWVPAADVRVLATRR